MKLHPRTMPVQKAESEFGMLCNEWEQRHELTYGEMVQILSNRIVFLSRYMIRLERHPDDPTKKGDEE